MAGGGFDNRETTEMVCLNGIARIKSLHIERLQWLLINRKRLYDSVGLKEQRYSTGYRKWEKH